MPEHLNREMLLPRDSALASTDRPYPAEYARSANPTLVIGLGWLGYEVARRFHRRTSAAFGVERARLHQVLVFETRPQYTHRPDVPLPATDYVYLPVFHADKLVAEVDESDPLGKWWPPSYVPEYAGQGTAGIRALGRLIGHKYGPSFIAPRVRQKIRTLVSAHWDSGEKVAPHIYLVTSTAGGTGGMLLDVAEMARREIEAAWDGPYALRAVLLLPSVVLPQAATPAQRLRMQANGYASLREIDLQYAGPAQSGRKPPFDTTYLISRSNERGLTLSGPQVVCEMVSAGLFIENAPALTAPADDGGPDQGGKDGGKGRPRATKNPAIYSSFGVSSLVFPFEGVAAWCALRATGPLISRCLLSPALSRDDAGREATMLLEQAHILSDGSPSKLAWVFSSEQSSATVRKFRLPAARKALGDDTVNALANEWATCADTLDKARESIAQAVPRRGREWERLLRLAFGSATHDPAKGILYTSWLIGSLNTKLSMYRAGLANDRPRLLAAISPAEMALQEARLDLEEAADRPHLFTNRSSAARVSMNAYAVAANSLLTASLQVALAEGALALCDIMVESLSQLGEAVKQSLVLLDQDARETTEMAQDALATLRLAQNRPGIARSVVNEENLLEIFNRVRPPDSTPRDREDLAAAFWRYVALNRGTQTPSEQERALSLPGARGARPYDFLLAAISEKLSGMSLLDHLQAAHSPGDASQGWKQAATTQYENTAPFWSLVPTRGAREMNKTRPRLDLVSYGDDRTYPSWAAEIRGLLGEATGTARTTGNQEMLFMRSVHGLPLRMIREVEQDLKPEYLSLQGEWKAGRSALPVHASSEWEALISEGAGAPAEPVS